MTWRVTQLSDTHFAADGARSHGGIGYDTDATFAAVLERLRDDRPADLTIITGDLADHGQHDEYVKAAQRLAELDGPVAVVPGNHDFHVPFETMLPAPSVAMPRTMRLGNWLFVFVDTNVDGRVRDASGHRRDKPDRIETNGNLDLADVAWINEISTQSSAEHVFVWGHHPPFMPGAFNVPDYDERASALFAGNPKLRGMAAGHVHTDAVLDRERVPVFICPALTFNFSVSELTALPPGYRTYEFGDDGSVRAECVLVDGPAWPRFALPEPGVRYLRGEIGWGELMTELGLDG